MTFDAAERVADAVLYEGYVLYPYRASAAKNHFRWQFGVVAPRPPHEEDGEPWFTQTECVIEASTPVAIDASTGRRHRIAGSKRTRPTDGPTSSHGRRPLADAPVGRILSDPPQRRDCQLSIRVRFLRPQLAAGGSSTWLEGAPHAVDFDAIDLGALPLARELPIRAGSVEACISAHAEAVDGFIKLRLTLENRESWRAEFRADRDAMLAHSLVGAHLLLEVEHGSFVSLLEPSEAAAPAAAGCQNRHTWPVLVGDRSRRNLMLSSPIVLYDYPSVAKESQGDLCDAAEIDEILSLRILTMTDEEKREARATDPRAKAILDRVDALTPDALSALHGTMRSADFFNPPSGTPPDRAFVMIGTSRIEKGSHVRLRPNRRADAMDMFLRDQAATVAGVYRDVDDRAYVAITVDADPAATLHESFGRFFYFDPEEVEPIVAQPEQRGDRGR